MTRSVSSLCSLLERIGRIHLGGVDEINAMIKRHVDLRMAFSGCVLGSPCHRAETEKADIEISAAKLFVDHR